MKKVLALVLALTMLVGFSANMFAYPDLFTTTKNVSFWLGNDNAADRAGKKVTVGSTYISVPGNKEQTVNYEFDLRDIVFDYLVGDIYSGVKSEYDAAQLIRTFLSLYPAAKATTADLATLTASLPNGTVKTALGNYVTYMSANGGTNTLAQAVAGTGDRFATKTVAIGAVDGTNPLAAIAVNELYADTADHKAVAAWDSTVFATNKNLSEAMTAAETAYSTFNTSGYYQLYSTVTVEAKSKNPTYATITTGASYPAGTNQTTYDNTRGGSFKVMFTNTTFDYKDVEIDVTFRSTYGGTIYERTETLKFRVTQAQVGNYTEGMAAYDFASKDAVEIPADKYAYIEAGAFKIMLQNANRSITVVNGMGDSKVRFDKDSTNIPQDVFIGNFKTSGTGTANAATLTGFASTTAAKVKIAVGKPYYDANFGKKLTVYDANGMATTIEATLQGDYTINFYAPLAQYTIGGPGYTGGTVIETGKTNPGMGGC